MKNYKFHADAGHGWLAVKVEELCRLGIEYDISQFSYIKGKTAYLEEDCDLARFMIAKESVGEPVYFADSVNRSNYSPIRSYDSYTAGRVSKLLASEEDRSTQWRYLHRKYG